MEWKNKILFFNRDRDCLTLKSIPVQVLFVLSRFASMIGLSKRYRRPDRFLLICAIERLKERIANLVEQDMYVVY
jgi:hypothetical protein